MSNMQVITFDSDLKDFVLSAFGKKESHGQLVEVDTGEVVLTPNGESLSKKEFAGIAKGSEIFIKSDIVSLIDFYEKSELWGSSNL